MDTSVIILPKLNLNSMKRLSLIVFLVFLSSCGAAPGGDFNSGDTPVSATGIGTALLSWLPPTENTDKSVLTDLAGYKIYYGTSPGIYSTPIIINNPGLSSILVEDLAISDWYFVMTAFNSSGIESGYSTEVSKSIN